MGQAFSSSKSRLWVKANYKHRVIDVQMKIEMRSAAIILFLSPSLPHPSCYLVLVLFSDRHRITLVSDRSS